MSYNKYSLVRPRHLIKLAETQPPDEFEFINLQ